MLFPFPLWEVSEYTYIEYLDIGSGGVVVSQALQSCQSFGKQLVCGVYSAEIK